MRLDGFISLASVTTPSGDTLTASEAVKAGFVRLGHIPTEGWPSLDPGEVPVGTNLHTDGGRQLMVYCWGNRAPITDYACTYFSVGTGTTPPTVSDLGLEATVPGFVLKSVNSIDYPEPFIARVSLTLGPSDAVGYLITEMGLFSGNGTLINRATLDVPLNKGNLSKTYLWRLRF